jgi:hypothetical protein
LISGHIRELGLGCTVGPAYKDMLQNGDLISIIQAFNGNLSIRIPNLRGSLLPCD